MKRSVFLLLMTMLLIGMVGSYFFFSVAASRLSVQQYEAELEVVDARGATIIVAINQKRNVWEDVAQDAQLQRGGAIHDKNGKVVDHSALYYSSEYLYVELFISGTELSLYPIEGPDTAMSLLLDEETSQAAIAALDAYFDKVKTVEDSVKLGAELCSIMDGTQGIPNLQKDDWQLVVAIGGGIVMLGVIVVFELLKKQTRAAKTQLKCMFATSDFLNTMNVGP